MPGPHCSPACAGSGWDQEDTGALQASAGDSHWRSLTSALGELYPAALWAAPVLSAPLWDHISASVAGRFHYALPTEAEIELPSLRLSNLRPLHPRLHPESLGSAGPQPRPPSLPMLCCLLLSLLRELSPSTSPRESQPPVRQMLRCCLLELLVTGPLGWKPGRGSQPWPLAAL